jgi:hypothetical protein
MLFQYYFPFAWDFLTKGKKIYIACVDWQAFIIP